MASPGGERLEIERRRGRLGSRLGGADRDSSVPLTWGATLLGVTRLRLAAGESRSRSGPLRPVRARSWVLRGGAS